MATINTTVLHDGPRNAIIKLDAFLDSGDAETDALKVDVSALAPDVNGAAPTNVSVLQIMFSTQNVEVDLQWEGDGNPTFYPMPSNFAEDVDFMRFGGVRNDTNGRTGNILLTTKTRTIPSLDANYSITLWLKKRYN